MNLSKKHKKRDWYSHQLEVMKRITSPFNKTPNFKTSTGTTKLIKMQLKNLRTEETEQAKEIIAKEIGKFMLKENLINFEITEFIDSEDVFFGLTVDASVEVVCKRK